MYSVLPIVPAFSLTGNGQKCYNVFTKSKTQKEEVLLLSQAFLVFLQVVDCGSFSKAAKTALFVDRPASVMKHMNAHGKPAGGHAAEAEQPGHRADRRRKRFIQRRQRPACRCGACSRPGKKRGADRGGHDSGRVFAVKSQPGADRPVGAACRGKVSDV